MIPLDIAKGTPIFYPHENCLDVSEWKFSIFVPGGTAYVRTNTGHTPRSDRCYLSRKEAVQVCIRGLQKRIRELEKSVRPKPHSILGEMPSD